jgi:hypothetical protein
MPPFPAGAKRLAELTALFLLYPQFIHGQTTDFVGVRSRGGGSAPGRRQGVPCFIAKIMVT